MNQQKPFAFFQRHPTSGIWQEVIASAAGEDGVVAAYFEGPWSSVLADEHPDDSRWIDDRHLSIATDPAHQPVEGQGMVHLDAITDALRQGLARGLAQASMYSLEAVPTVLEHVNPAPALVDQCEQIDATLFKDGKLCDNVCREELKGYVERWASAIAEHETTNVQNAAGVAEAALEQPASAARPDAAVGEVRGEEQVAPELVPDSASLSRVNQVGWSYTEEGGKKYLVRERREGERVAHMVEGILYEGKPIEGVPETIRRLSEWLHAAYDRPPQAPATVAMLARIDALTAVRQHVFMPAGAEPAAEIRSLTNQYGTMKAAFLIDKTLADGTLLYVGAKAPENEVQEGEN